MGHFRSRCTKISRSTTLALLIGGWVWGCGPVPSAEPEWPPQAFEWYERAQASFRNLDSDDALESVDKALKLQPERPEVKLLAARIALARLDYDQTHAYLTGLNDSRARALRGRAYWYAGKITEAAEELEALLADPSARDPWAEGVVKLARTGRGRQPFTLSGSQVAVVEMPRLSGTAMVVPLELDGQPVLGLISTGTTEVVVDSAGGRQPSWVNLRFQDRIQVKDVPALTQDLSGISRELNAPIKVMLGSNLLRHLNVTFDFLGRQFVVRNYESPPPPQATKLPVQYVRGGGMVLSSRIGAGSEAPSFSLFVDTGSSYPVVLDEAAWERTKITSEARRPLPGKAGVTQARLPQLHLGAFVLADVSAYGGVPFEELERVLEIDLDGLLGSGVLSAFRVTLADQGRTMWLEDGPVPTAGPVETPQPEAEQDSVD